MNIFFLKRAIYAYLLISFSFCVSSCAGAASNALTTWSLIELVTIGSPLENSALEIVEVKNCGIPSEKTTECSAGTNNDLSLSLGSGGGINLGAEIEIDGSFAATLGVGQQSGESVKLPLPPDGLVYRYTIEKKFKTVAGQALARSSNGLEDKVNFRFHASCTIEIVKQEQFPCSESSSQTTYQDNSDNFVPDSTSPPLLFASPLPSPSPLPILQAIIEYPQNNAFVNRKEYVTGTLTGLGTKRAFLIIQSLASPGKIYPQNDGELNFELMPDSAGKWSMRGIFATSGATYKAYIVATDDPTLIDMFSLRDNALYGIDPTEVPLASIIISNVIAVTVR